MPRDFLSYWLPETARRELRGGGLVIHAASNQYGRLVPGDTVWIVTVSEGELVLVARVSVDAVMDQRAAAQRLKCSEDALWAASHHIIEDERTASPAQELAITDIADALRFVSRRQDRLTIVGGRVDAKQLQSMRVLTGPAATLLAARWAGEGHAGQHAIDEAHALPSSGAGFGDATRNRQVEQAAVATATALLVREGWEVRSVEDEQLGYDLHCQRGGESRHVEVKGTYGRGAEFIMTANEYHRARTDPLFELIVVSSALDSPTAARLAAAEVLARYAFAPIAYRAKPVQPTTR